MFVDKDQHARKSELCWSLLSTLRARYRCRNVGAPKISLVNEVQCGTGTEWRDLIGQHFPCSCQQEQSQIRPTTKKNLPHLNCHCHVGAVD